MNLQHCGFGHYLSEENTHQTRKSRRASVQATVQECKVFNRLELSLSEKQIPRFVGNVRS